MSEAPDRAGRPRLSLIDDAEAVWREEAAFVSVAEATAATAGVEFFRTLVKELAEALRVRYAFVAEFAGTPVAVRTIAFWGDTDWMDNIEYNLQGTPCADVLGGKLCFYKDGVCSLFPDDRELLRLRARSYLGVPLLNPDGQAVGHLAAIDREPMSEDARGLSIFRVFANRARVELERLRAEATLARARRKLQFEVEEQSRRLDLARQELEALLGINRAVARHLQREELFTTVGRVIRKVVPADRLVVLLPEPESMKIRIYALHADEADSRLYSGETFDDEDTAASWAYRERRSFRAGSPEELGERFPVTRAKLEQEGMQSVCAVPLLSGDECRGVVGLMARDRNAYEELEETLIEQVAAAVAVALDNCLAYEELSRLRDQLAAENVYLQQEIQQEHNFREIVGNSPPLMELLTHVERVAPTDSTVLLLGETGTGKELIARAIHDSSRRRERPLVKVNCSAISAGLVESELFGHVKGAFTGATSSRVGRFELADGGTIFLDEIGELPPETQVKLLRVLQEREFEPVGSSRTRSVDVRVLAATNRDLEAAMEKGRFRSDLYYRLNVLPMVVPPLRERRQDIPLLVAFFVQRYAAELGKEVRRVDPETMDRLCAYHWPGNVRELQNLVERGVVLAHGDRLIVDQDLPNDGSPGDSPHPPGGALPASGIETLETLEKRHIRAALDHTGGVIAGDRGAAKLLGLHPSTLRSRMQKLGVERAGRESASE